MGEGLTAKTLMASTSAAGPTTTSSSPASSTAFAIGDEEVPSPLHGGDDHADREFDCRIATRRAVAPAVRLPDQRHRDHHAGRRDLLVPDGSTVLEAGDELVLIGPDADIEAIRELAQAPRPPVLRARSRHAATPPTV